MKLEEGHGGCLWGVGRERWGVSVTQINYIRDSQRINTRENIHSHNKVTQMFIVALF